MRVFFFGLLSIQNDECITYLKLALIQFVALILFFFVLLGTFSVLDFLKMQCLCPKMNSVRLLFLILCVTGFIILYIFVVVNVSSIFHFDKTGRLFHCLVY